jgi:hypothetical protein
MASTQDRGLSLVRALIYGDSGIGKTTSLKTLPADRTLIAAAERGLLPLAGCNYPVAVIEAWDDVRELVKACSVSPLVIDGKTITVLAIDSLTEISELCKRQIVSIDRKKLLTDRTKGKSDAPPGIYDDLMTQEDWGLYKTRMANMLSSVCHLPVNIIFTALASWTKDKRSGALLRTPNLYGKMSTECPAHFDLVLHMESVDSADENGQKVNTRVWKTYNDGQVMAKDSSGKLDAYEPADWTKIIRKVVGKKGGVA